MKQQNKKIRGIIVGGSGLIGGAFVHYFNKCCSKDIEILSPNSKKMNIADKDDIERYTNHWKPDFIINAAIAAIDSDPQLTYSINYIGSINLAIIAAKLHIPYIFISSAAVLPDGEELLEDQENSLAASLSNYAKSKLMCEMTLKHMHEQQGLDFTAIRLAIVYGKHDHKTQGFHRLLHSIAEQAMPIIPTAKGVQHSYTNAKKIPYFIHHTLKNRSEFSGQLYNFVDPEPVELAHLIKTIRNFLGVTKPRNIFLPLRIANCGIYVLKILQRQLLCIGIDVKLPAELMFLDQFYKTQTLNSAKLKRSSFTDPWPEETVYSELPEMIEHYISRWEQLNCISGFNDDFFEPQKDVQQFINEPQQLLEEIHGGDVTPFGEFSKFSQTKK
ncbi:SDR family oxidoreductase [Desulfocapsa sp. AH-315-G09]|uniref:SDR family oxidoreductase n=1 Tax=Desulfotalea psychrophila TaxID=84980 RepID=A0ABS3ASR5_9BACT|nr:SDR family oxidoreductase [Desulfocapsa sp.]MBN4065061.1 SDR family oxidoreductase [Desulfocapsa sp. AH-315-G09]MBN4067972.1 SDR family oxidoreductase [Desulfotalea psychrophila]